MRISQATGRIFLRQVMDFSNTVHFSEGHLDRRTKEASPVMSYA